MICINCEVEFVSLDKTKARLHIFSPLVYPSAKGTKKDQDTKKILSPREKIERKKKKFEEEEEILGASKLNFQFSSRFKGKVLSLLD